MLGLLADHLLVVVVVQSADPVINHLNDPFEGASVAAPVVVRYVPYRDGRRI